MKTKTKMDLSTWISLVSIIISITAIVISLYNRKPIEEPEEKYINAPGIIDANKPINTGERLIPHQMEKRYISQGGEAKPFYVTPYPDPNNTGIVTTFPNGDFDGNWVVIRKRGKDIARIDSMGVWHYDDAVETMSALNAAVQFYQNERLKNKY